MMQRVVAPILGVSVTDIHVVTNDTSYHDEGLGTYASRSTVFVGSAVHDGALRLKQELQAVVARSVGCDPAEEIGRAHVGTPVTNAHHVCRLLLEKKNTREVQYPNY